MPPSTPWVYDSRLRGSGYRNTSTGRIISQREAAAMRDTFIDAQKARLEMLTDQLVDGKINLQQWVYKMRETIKDTYSAEYAASKGGIQNVTQAEWGKESALLRRQYEYLNDFAKDIAEGKLSPAQINARAKLYVEGASQMYERGKAESKGMPELPAYPGDGKTICHTNCHCNWEIEETDTEWRASWRLGEAEHCIDCVANANHWNPLVFPK